jgi:hypothetical protein
MREQYSVVVHNRRATTHNKVARVSQELDRFRSPLRRKVVNLWKTRALRIPVRGKNCAARFMKACAALGDSQHGAPGLICFSGLGRQPRTQSGLPGTRLNCTVIAQTREPLNHANLYACYGCAAEKSVRRFASASLAVNTNERQRTTTNAGVRLLSFAGVHRRSLSFVF